MGISSMTAVSRPADREAVNFSEPHPCDAHWTRTCEHELVARLKKYAKCAKARMQCRKCGVAVGSFIPSAGVYELWDDDLERRGAESYTKACDEWREKAIAWSESERTEKSEAWWAAYEIYLASAIWTRKKALVYDRNRRLHRGLCEACGESPPEHVHHTSYPTSMGLAFGQEPLWCLRAVCRRCHEIFHPHMKEQ